MILQLFCLVRFHQPIVSGIDSRDFSCGNTAKVPVAYQYGLGLGCMEGCVEGCEGTAEVGFLKANFFPSASRSLPKYEGAFCGCNI